MVYLKLNSEGIDHYLTYWSKLKVKIKIVHFIWIIGLIFVLPSFAQAKKKKNEDMERTATMDILISVFIFSDDSELNSIKRNMK